MRDKARSLLAMAVCLAFLALLAASPHAGDQGGDQGGSAATHHTVAAEDGDEPSLPAPLDGLRGTLKALDALILAFQKESETFTKLLEVYRHGGQPWRRLKQEIDRAWREVRGEEII